MSEHTEQTTAPVEAVPARIDLEEFIEAVTRGVTRAMAAQDEVSGYFLRSSESTERVRPVYAPGGVTMGLIFYPPTYPFPSDTSGGTLGGGYVGSVR